MKNPRGYTKRTNEQMNSDLKYEMLKALIVTA